jgi:hypothetical protein
MKLIIASSTLFTMTYASFAEMEKSFAEIMKNKTASFDRAFPVNQFSLALVSENYGCWCHSLKEHTGKGKSKPLDALDALCKSLSEGYDCASIDAEAEGLTCNAWEEDYSDEFGNSVGCGKLKTAADVVGIPESVLAQLGINVVSNCKKQACLIEQNFVNSLAALFLDNSDIANPEYKHESIDFDSEASCITHQCEGAFCEGEKQCCGSIPQRRTYKPKSEAGVDRICCGETLFLDSGINECCADAAGVESAAPIGQCPL